MLLAFNRKGFLLAFHMHQYEKRHVFCAFGKAIFAFAAISGSNENLEIFCGETRT